MLRTRIIKSITLTLLSPIFALPFFFVICLFIALKNPPGTLDPLREALGPLKYNLRWSIRAAPFYEILLISSLAMKFYISVPLLLIGNYALFYKSEKIRHRLARYMILAFGTGLYFAAVIYAGLWLGLWEEPFWT
jgi:hypothetical protein